ncbi:MAG: divalent-cation tolerance protein CutA [Candidatus Altiarchaeota archaeon]|nr:divalent-cation tolerance protein CutA [Candidatus Altiarchaeota archaeon]
MVDEVSKMHPYEVPCISCFKADGNDPFEGWIAEETA